MDRSGRIETGEVEEPSSHVLLLGLSGYRAGNGPCGTITRVVVSGSFLGSVVALT